MLTYQHRNFLHVVIRRALVPCSHSLPYAFLARDSPPDEVFPTLIPFGTSALYHYRTLTGQVTPSNVRFFVFGSDSLSPSQVAVSARLGPR